MPFAITHYHLVWTTAEKQPTLTREHVGIVIDTIDDYCEKMHCKIFAVSVLPDHVHIALSIPPRMAVAEWISDIKTRTAQAAAQSLPGAPVTWGGGFGVVTFGAQNKDKVIRYVKRQRALHAENALTEVFERVDE
jgi:putative transposase